MQWGGEKGVPRTSGEASLVLLGGNISPLYRGPVPDKGFSETGQGERRKSKPGL